MKHHILLCNQLHLATPSNLQQPLASQMRITHISLVTSGYQMVLKHSLGLWCVWGFILLSEIL